MLIIPIIRFSHTFYTCIQLGTFITFIGIFPKNGIFKEKKPKNGVLKMSGLQKKCIFIEK